ncbi:MAG TPA: hypothetical protein VF731_12225 [Solirubrobacterales bacterium]
MQGGGLKRTLGHIYLLSRFYPHYVREVVSWDGGKRAFAIPAYGRAQAVPPARCFASRARRQRLVEQERRRRVELAYCILMTRAGAHAVGLGCEPFAAAREGGAVWASVPVIRTPLIELVPTGVSEVRVSYRNRRPIDARVEEDAYRMSPPSEPGLESRLKRLVQAPRRSSRYRLEAEYESAVAKAAPTRLEWLGTGGKTIRVIHAPASGVSGVPWQDVSAPRLPLR